MEKSRKFSETCKWKSGGSTGLPKHGRLNDDNKAGKVSVPAREQLDMAETDQGLNLRNWSILGDRRREKNERERFPESSLSLC